MPSIREARMEDLEALGRIAYQTGFFGASAAAFFPSEQLFSDLWVRPYLCGAGASNFVAEVDRRPIGYILGTRDLRAYQGWMLRHAPEFLWRALSGKYSRFLGSLRYLLRLALYPSKLAPFDQFPAQLHINLLPESRGLGLGGQLMQAYLDCLGSKNVAGVQLSTTKENAAAVGLYEKFGFGVYREYLSPVWRPWLGREVVHLVMVKSLR